MDCTSKKISLWSQTHLFFVSLVSSGALNTLKKGTFVVQQNNVLLCWVLKSLLYCYEIVLCSSTTEKCTTWPQFLLAANQASVSVVRFASWELCLFIIALFREFRSLFLENAGFVMWSYILYLQSKHCKNQKLYLWWLLVVNLGNIIQSCWANRSDLVLYFHCALMQIHPYTHTYVMQL